MGDRLLFVCYGNSCRSILAEAIARQVPADSVQVVSAGIRPLGQVSDYALIALEERAIACRGLHSKGFGDIFFPTITLTINLTTGPILPFLPVDYHGKLLEHPVMDPFGQGLNVFRQVRDQLLYWITNELQHDPVLSSKGSK